MINFLEWFFGRDPSVGSMATFMVVVACLVYGSLFLLAWTISAIGVKVLLVFPVIAALLTYREYKKYLKETKNE